MLKAADLFLRIPAKWLLEHCLEVFWGGARGADGGGTADLIIMDFNFPGFRFRIRHADA